MTGQLERHRGALLTTIVGVFLIVAGRYAYSGISVGGRDFGWVTVLRVVFVFLVVLMALSILGVFVGALNSATGNGKASMGQGLIFSSVIWIASDRAELDWRAIRTMVVVTTGLVVAVLVPEWVWGHAPLFGGLLLAGQVVGWFWTDLFTDSPRWGRWLPARGQVADAGWGRDARRIRRDWPRMVQDLMSKTEGPVKTKVKAPKLLDVEVSDRMVRLVVEPPSMWTVDGLAQLATGLKNEWGGVQSDVRFAGGERMRRRRMVITIAMEPLPESIPYPAGDHAEGAPLGVDVRGDVIRLIVGQRGVPHVLVAGQSGSGKSSAMRVLGAGLVARGAEVFMIDPKGEGDLDGITSHPTMFRPAEWAAHFDWLLDEQERRASVKQAGGDPGPPIVTMIDELTQLATGMGARTEAEAKDLAAAHKAYMRCIFIGRGTGIHIVSGIQQASAEAMGGKMATAVRDQHLGRVLLGRASSVENRKMVFGDRNLTDEDVELMMEAPPGRAWVSGTAGKDNGSVHCVQVFDVPEATVRSGGGAEAGGVGATSPHLTLLDTPPDVATNPSPASDPGQPALRDLILDHLEDHPGGVLRADLSRVTDPPVPTSTLRRVLRSLRDQGLVWFEDGPQSGNQPVVVFPGPGPVSGSGHPD